MKLLYSYKIPDKLYHASPACFRSFDLDKAYNLKDFGKGFYLTDNYNQALEWANNKRRANEGYIYEYKINKEKISNVKLNIIEFLTYSTTWGRFLAAHRHEIIEDAGIDLIYNRMADSSSEEMTKAIDHFYEGVEDSEENMLKIFTKRNAQTLKYNQYCFKSQKAINLLYCKKVAIVSGDKANPNILWKGASDFYEQKGL